MAKKTKRKVLHGGKAEKKGVTASDFPPKVVAEGTKHEMEHTDDPSMAEQIAVDHFAEHGPGYYKDLKKIEKSRFVRPHYRGKSKVKGYTSPNDFEGLDSEHIYEMAKSALKDNELDLYYSIRNELERRAFVAKAIGNLASGYAGDPGARMAGDTSPESRHRPAEIGKKTVEAAFGISDSDEEESISKSELVASIRGIIAEEVGKQIEKAILTKPSDSREKPVSRAKPNSKAKVGVNSKGKTYQYDKNGTGGAPVPGKQGLPGLPGLEDTGPKDIEPEPEAKLNPDKLAGLLGTTVAALEGLAAKMDEHAFIVYFETHAAHVIKQYEIPKDYWVELYATLKQLSDARQAQKSLNNKDQFDLNNAVYSNGSEMYNVVTDLGKAGVCNLRTLEDFLVNNYDVAASDVHVEADRILKALLGDGAVVMK